jgi:hypothetical protein
MSRRLLLTAALLTLAALSPAHSANRCANFKAVEAGTEMPDKFKIKGITFKDRAGGFTPVVHNITDGLGRVVHGLSFDPRGIQIALPEPAAQASVRLVVPPGQTVRLRAFDALGETIYNVLCTNENLSEEGIVAPGSQPIVRLMLDGGGGQATVDQVCETP